MFQKISEGLIYRDPEFYSSFPGVANLGNGEIFVVFRRAPRYSGLPGVTPSWCVHLDRNSKLMCMRSHDNGKTWEKPRLLFAPDLGAAQDGGVMFDGKMLFVNSFQWGNLPDHVIKLLRESGQDEYIFSAYGGSNLATVLGSFALRSKDGGKEWEGPFIPDPIPGYPDVHPGRPLRMHNRANIIRLPDGRLLYPGQALHYRPKYMSSVVLYESRDDGETWQYLATPAPDYGEAIFEEPCITLTASGKLVLLIRTHRGPDGVEYPDSTGVKRANLWLCESTDGGRTWTTPVDLGIHGEPATTARMDDGRILLAYGYRMEPFGVRARICNPEMTDIAEAEEIVIRDDCGRADCGYPWIAPLGNDQYMIVYYRNPPDDGCGGIYATIAEIK
ncbi:MAG: exo-alpha-sialidase [Lentisphaeria bacterium]|nr:exo-alpha-sialidase [Lentisphaeria bacterium]